MLWYDAPPASRARYLRFNALEGRESLAAFERQIALGSGASKPWTPADIAARRRQIRRLEAAASLYEVSSAATAREVDDYGLSDPTLPTALEVRLVEAILSGDDQKSIDMLAYRPGQIEGKVTIALSSSPDRAIELVWCEIRSEPDADGAFLVYAINGYWAGTFDPSKGTVAIDGLEGMTDPAFELWRGEVPFSSHFAKDAITWLKEELAKAWVFDEPYVLPEERQSSAGVSDEFEPN